MALVRVLSNGVSQRQQWRQEPREVDRGVEFRAVLMSFNLVLKSQSLHSVKVKPLK